ncbi:MAG: DUF433 domain-containing protein [Rhodomicrobium sp.]
MTHVLERLTTAEAALVACVTVRDVNRLYDEKMLPEELLLRSFIRVNHDRFVAAWACAIIAFYFKTAEQLTAGERIKAITALAPEVSDAFSKMPHVFDRGVWHYKKGSENFLKTSGEDALTFRDEFLIIDSSKFVVEAQKRLLLLSAAKSMVETSPEILSGTPVVAGTRVPVYDIAASVEAGIPVDRILRAYPGLDRERVELAAFYAKAIPPRGRPKSLDLPKGAIIVTDRRAARRKRA